MIRKVAIAIAAIIAGRLLAGPVALEWPAFLEDARPARFTVVRGDTVELAARLFADGRPYMPDAADASLLWQTNGMGALWWEAPAAVASNRVSATWTPAMDPGAPSYLAHFRVGSGTGSVFRAYARLSMQHGPGDPPNALPLPVPVLDFAKVAVTNEPWGASGLTTNDVRAIVESDAGPTNRIVHADEDGSVTVANSFSAAGGALRAGGGMVFYQPGSGDSTDEEYEAVNHGMMQEAIAAMTNALGSAAFRDAEDFATAADEALVYQLLTNRLSGVTFDFATVAGLYLAISNIVAAQGGTITNFPAIP